VEPTEDQSQPTQLLPKLSPKWVFKMAKILRRKNPAAMIFSSLDTVVSKFFLGWVVDVASS
jgi:hypothetical protein